ncbi:MAG: ATP-grasp domain-containing protein, partial [Candidatus Dependentiae bacterium]|nr:ATP-grasp domain-containing protein [Candidatus Dependentiae bacterium]
MKKITSFSSNKKQEILVLLNDPSLGGRIKKGGASNFEDFETIKQLKKALGALNEYNFTYISDHKTLISVLESVKADFVFNLCDEGYNNDARMELHVPALLEMLGIPYSGAAPDGLAVCYNKSIVRNIALSLNIAVPAETYFDHNDPYAKTPTDFPVIVKPNLGDSSFGITKDAVVHNAKELKQYIEQVLERMSDTSLLIQEFLPGDEYSVSIIGNRGNYTILPIMKVNYEKLSSGLPKILGYESKWLPDSPYWTHISYQQANLDEKDSATMIEASIKMFERTACRDYARFDFRADANGVIKLLEVNPNPGWCLDG